MQFILIQSDNKVFSKVCIWNGWRLCTPKHTNHFISVVHSMLNSFIWYTLIEWVNACIFIIDTTLLIGFDAKANLHPLPCTMNHLLSLAWCRRKQQEECVVVLYMVYLLSNMFRNQRAKRTINFWYASNKKKCKRCYKLADKTAGLWARSLNKIWPKQSCVCIFSFFRSLSLWITELLSSFLNEQRQLSASSSSPSISVINLSGWEKGNCWIQICQQLI